MQTIRKRKGISLAVAFLIAFIFIMMLRPRPSRGSETNEREEVSIDAVLIAEHGFDDNDRIEAVVTGELPHACYTLGDTVVESAGRGVLRVHQYAWLRTTGNCSGGEVPDAPMPYTVEITLGQLSAGHYDVQYRTSSGRVVSRALAIVQATSASIDDYPYAQVKAVDAPALLLSDEDAVATLRGVFALSCERLVEPVRVQRQNDVFVVLPVLERDLAVPCVRESRQFSVALKLGRLKPGQYLVHVRSANGKAANRVLDVQR